MNTLAPISPDQRPNLHTADQPVAPLSTSEQAQFNEIAGNFNAPVEDPRLNGSHLGEFAPVADLNQEEERQSVLSRIGVGINRAKLSVGALGGKLRREKAANDQNPERSTKMRKALVAGTVAVAGAVYLGYKTYAGMKGIETHGVAPGTFDDVLSSDMDGGTGHAAASHSVEAFSGNHAPGGASILEAAPGVPDTIEPTPAPNSTSVTPPTPTSTPGKPKIGLNPNNPLFPFIVEEAPATPDTPANPNTPTNPVDIQVKANQDPTKVLGKTWEMPEYKGPEDSLGAKMEGYLKNAFEANNLDPKTMTETEKQAVIDAFIKENDIKDTHNMHTGTYKTEATGKRITDLVKEHLAKDADAKKTAAEKAAQAAAELSKTSVKLDEVKGIDVSKLPKDLKLDNVIVHDGDGLYRIFDQLDPKPTQQQQDDLVRILSSNQVRESLIKFAPDTFMDHEFPKGHPREGQHELWLRANGEKPLVNADQQKQINDMYHRILEDLEKQQKEADTKTSTTTPPATPAKPQTPNPSTPSTPNQTPAPSTPSTPPSTSPSKPSSSTPSPSSSTPAPTSSSVNPNGA